LSTQTFTRLKIGRNDFKLSCKLSSRSLIVFTKNCSIILFSCPEAYGHSESNYANLFS